MLNKRFWRLRYFKCPICGAVNTAPKTEGLTHKGHIKTMYCFMCKRETDQIQIDADKTR